MQQYRKIVWDPDRHFQPWFGDCTEDFRSVLYESGAIVSGSQILQFLDRTTYLNSDMDIFLRIGGVLTMGNWLEARGYSRTCDSEDYVNHFKFQRDVIQTACRVITGGARLETAVKGVYNYRRFVGSTTDIYNQKIQLVAVDTNPVQHLLFDFHSTAVMNYMSCDTIVSVFPLSTFILRKSYISRTRPESPARISAWKDKYRARGFRLINKRSRGKHGDLKQGKRTSTDRHSWTMTLKGESNEFWRQVTLISPAQHHRDESRYTDYLQTCDSRFCTGEQVQRSPTHSPV
ncbi:hypothetical protein DFH09DRAFT_913344 [Mycena vulgaris]|nr:hypothetical protein DFH09DRAFT_913344 [Mycena vulgaris]